MTLLSYLKVSNLAIESETTVSKECVYSLNETAFTYSPDLWRHSRHQRSSLTMPITSYMSLCLSCHLLEPLFYFLL